MLKVQTSKGSFIKQHFETSNHSISRKSSHLPEILIFYHVNYSKMLATTILYLVHQWVLIFFRPLGILVGRAQLQINYYQRNTLSVIRNILFFLSRVHFLSPCHFPPAIFLTPCPLVSPKNHMKPMKIWLLTSIFLACRWIHPQYLLNFENIFYPLWDDCPKDISTRNLWVRGCM